MNRFGEIADEMTELLEELEHPRYAAYATPLRRVLERAFARACEAERVARLVAPELDKGPPRASNEPGAVVIQLAERRRNTGR